MAEALALGSLCLEGDRARVTGQDVERGTFSQRHAVLHDQQSGARWNPLADLDAEQGSSAAHNSPLGEYATLGFEYGVSLADPHTLVFWEAQFGDFANNAQVMIDNYIASAETKWQDCSGLVMSLPHGFDGQGAEHSSARPERFLALCNEDGLRIPSDPVQAARIAKIGIVCLTDPANYFHILRRQLRRNYRKPLVVLFSKSLLRSTCVRSPKMAFTEGSCFQPVIDEPSPAVLAQGHQSVKRVVFCTRQVYFSLRDFREEADVQDVAIVRIEQLHPFPWEALKEVWGKYSNAQVLWAQEEHYNGGAWHYMKDRLDTLLHSLGRQASHGRIGFAGRPGAASAATGLKSIHKAEEAQLCRDAILLRESPPTPGA